MSISELQQKTARAIVNVFETGRIRGDYSAIAVLKGDSGHLSYGRSQATLGSGSLFKLLTQYCQAPNAKFAPLLQPFMARVQQKDFTLDTDSLFRDALKRAGREDALMRKAQDDFFNAGYFTPACTAAEKLGITEALSIAVIYDSRVQGGWGTLSARMGPVVDQHQWVSEYIDTRNRWLLSLNDPLPNTVYRMKSFRALIDGAKPNWTLALPLAVHGVEITEAALQDEDAVQPSGAPAPRLLTLVTPYLRGPDVLAVQTKLQANGLPTGTPDGVYGPFTAQLVAKWQRDKSISETGVGDKTRASLGL